MKKQDEDDELTFQLLGGQAKQLMKNLSDRPKQTDDRPDPRTQKEKPVSDPEQRDRYIDWGLEQIRKLERRHDPQHRARRKNRNL